MIDTVRLGRRMVKAAIGRDVTHRAELTLPSETFGRGDGGWVVYTRALSSNSVVYSFGVGEDASFDLSLATRFDLTVNAFDPTPRAIEWVEAQRLPQSFIFHCIGIADFDGTASFHEPPNRRYVSFRLAADGGVDGGTIKAEVRRLSTIMNDLGHNHVDVLKLDVEGAEYSVLADIISSRLDVRQILVEYHHRFESIGIDKTNWAVKALLEHGYRLFYVSPRGEEYSFIRSDRIF